MKVCTNAYTVTKKDNYFSVMTDSVEIRILFLTDSILRIRAGFDGDFAEESYSLVMTAWEDRMDDFLKGRRTRVEAADAVLSDGDREYCRPDWMCGKFFREKQLFKGQGQRG